MDKLYRQVTYRLRVQRGPGRPDLVSTRPRDERMRQYKDLDKPTLVKFDEHCQVDLAALLRQGAIEEYEPPKPEPPKAVKSNED